MNGTWTDSEIRSLRSEVQELRREIQQVKSDLFWAESNRRFNRTMFLMVVAIVLCFAAFGAFLALAVPSAGR